MSDVPGTSEPGYEAGRNESDQLVCQYEECGRPILGMTGFQEIQNLIAHMAEHHMVTLDVTEALDLRVKWEER